MSAVSAQVLDAAIEWQLCLDSGTVSAEQQHAFAAWLAAHPQVAAVNHPALPGSKGHEFWKRDFTGAGGLFSVIFDDRYSEAQTDRFVDALKLFNEKLTPAWSSGRPTGPGPATRTTPACAATR